VHAPGLEGRGFSLGVVQAWGALQLWLRFALMCQAVLGVEQGPEGIAYLVAALADVQSY
jgi:hypothetical protein